jgi:hypothetical protein
MTFSVRFVWPVPHPHVAIIAYNVHNFYNFEKYGFRKKLRKAFTSVVNAIRGYCK